MLNNEYNGTVGDENPEIISRHEYSIKTHRVLREFIFATVKSTTPKAHRDFQWIHLRHPLTGTAR